MTYEGGGSYVSVARNLLSASSASLESFAAAGWKVEKLVSVWQTEIRDAGFDTIIILSGVPDLTTAGSTATSIFQSLKTIYDDAMSRGIQVVSVSVCPWRSTRNGLPIVN